MSKLQEADRFLRTRLRRGPVPVAQLVQEAAQAGIARRTLFRAADKLNLPRLPEEGGQRVRYWASAKALAQRAERVMVAAAQMRNLMRRGLSWQFALHRMRVQWRWDDDFEAAVITKATRKWP